MYEVYGGLLKEDIVCTINGKKVCCPPESTILEAARGAGIDIPTLCYLKGLTPTGACGICAVEIEEEFDVEIPDREAMGLETVADAIKIIEEYMD